MYKHVKLGNSSFIRELWETPKNCNFVKPSGGIWASKYTPDEEYISSWQRFCKCENFSTGRMDKAVMFNFKSDSKIYTIDNFNDLRALMHKYKDNNTLLPFLSVLDFEKFINTLRKYENRDFIYNINRLQKNKTKILEEVPEEYKERIIEEINDLYIRLLSANSKTLSFFILSFSE